MKKSFVFGCLVSVLTGCAGFALGAAAPSTERVYLSGRDAATAVPWDFRVSAGARAGEWAKLPVPSNWEMHGFGTLSYGSVNPSESGEYRHRFAVPRDWQGRRVRIVFDGVMTDTRVRVNGESAGPVHQGGFYRFAYDLTALLRYGEENLLEVSVDETSANEGVNKAERTGDYWNFGGIFRPVWLEVRPTQSIERVAIDARADGRLSLDVFVLGEGTATQAEAQVVDDSGRTIGLVLRAPLLAGASATRIAGRIEAPATWTAETPNLYSAEVRLIDAAGAVVHRMTTRFGFRTFELRRGDGFYLNGRRVVLQGANRHSFNATSGRCLSESDHRTDIQLMKEMNATAVRMSHYPPDERFLELCDEFGLYVLDELAGWQKSYDTPVGRALLEAMVKRDVNHPSVLLWDNGNEGGWNTELDGDFAKWDPQQRPVLHPWQIFNGVNTAHYRIYPQLPALAAGLETTWRYDPKDEGKRHEQPLIYLPTEFLHGLYDGGAGAGMEDYWTLMRSGKTFGGGFVWAWVDEGVRRPDTGEIDVRGNAAPDGILGPRREKEASFFTLKELWSPVVVRERELPADFDGTLTIENRFSFTNTAACRFTWELWRMPEPRRAGAVPPASIHVLAEQLAAAPSTEPGATGPLHLNLPPSWKDADVLALRIEDPHAKVLWTYTWPLAALRRFDKLSNRPGLDQRVVTVVEEPDTFVVTAGDLVARFAKSTGAVTELSRGAKKVSLGRGLRALTAESTLASLSARSDGPDVVVTSGYTGGLRSVEWRVRANGWIECAYTYAGANGSTYQGVGFDLPGSQVQAKQWVGDGPYRVWQNRRRGVSLGCWSNRTNDTITGWRGFEYPEFKGFFADVHWLTLETAHGRLTVVPRTPGLFVQVMAPDVPPPELQAKTAVSLPKVDLGLLHVIPAIGTKFSTPAETGPQGETPAAQPEYSGSFSLRWE
jgi:hypothetical protein